jgi:hypothetical protein
LEQYNGEIVPSWVSLDTSAQLLQIHSPKIEVQTSYLFYIRSTIGSDTYDKLVNITVNASVEEATITFEGATETIGTVAVGSGKSLFSFKFCEITKILWF